MVFENYCLYNLIILQNYKFRKNTNYGSTIVLEQLAQTEY